MDSELSVSSIGKPRELTLYAWGINTSGQVNFQMSESCVYQPISLPLVSPRWIATGSSHVVCVSDSGTVFTWGDNQKGQLGSTTTLSGEAPFAILSIALPCRSVSCGGSHSGLVDGEGGVWMWGNGIYGQLGMGLECEQCDQPTLLQKICHRDIQKVGDMCVLSPLDCLWTVSFSFSLFFRLCVCLWKWILWSTWTCSFS